MNYFNYFTEIEEHFVRRRGKHLLVSPMDWSLIATWRDSGVPLNVALRGIDIAMDGYFARPHRGASRVNTLFYCHQSVMEEFARHLESRVGEARDETAPGEEPQAGEEEGPDVESILRFISARIGEIERAREKLSEAEALETEDLDRALSRLEEIRSSVEGEARLDYHSIERDLAILDELLVRTLRPSVAEEEAAEWEKEAKKELKIYRKRLPKETYDKILENYRSGRVRRHFGIGELSLFHL